MGDGRAYAAAVLTAMALVVSSCDWGQFRYGANHSGATPDSGIESAAVPALVERWTATSGAAIESSPAVWGKSVYVGSDDGTLYARDAATGAPRWSVALDGAVRSSPAAAKNRVFVGSDDDTLSAFRADNGGLLWSAPVDGAFHDLGSAPVVASDTVFVAGDDALYAIRTNDGQQRWSTPITASGPLSPPSVANGLVYVASYADATVWAFRQDTGALEWPASVPGPRSSCADAISTPAVVDGVVYVALCPSLADPQSSLFAFQADDGALHWSGGDAIATTSPAVAGGYVYVGSAPDHTLEAYSTSDGTRQWTATTGDEVRSSPALAAGTVYVGSDDGKLYAYDADGEIGCAGSPRVCQPRWSATMGGPVRSSPAVADGRIHVGADDGVLYAYSLPPIGFGKSTLEGTTSALPTTMRFGRDGRLYVAQYDGLINAYTVERNGLNAYSVTATETIDLIQQIPNHDDDGTTNPEVTTRLITGLLIVGSAASPVVYVASSDGRFGGDAEILDTNSGVISRLNRVGGVWQRRDLVRGLPRSDKGNHATNALALDQAANILYVAQGGNTNMGAPSGFFGELPDYAYSGAILTIDLDTIGNTTYDLPTLVDEDHPELTGPFGGNRGKHQAKVTASSPVQVHAPGFRNPYGLVMTRLGQLWATDNGPNAGQGGPPIGEGPSGTCTNEVNEAGALTFADSIHLISGPGYYAGHANPTRGNQANTFNPTNPQSPVPAANPVECDVRPPPANGALATINGPTTGLTEFTATNFGSQMSGDLIVTGFGGGIHRLRLNDTGTQVLGNDVLFSNVGPLLVDVAARGDTGTFPGTIWALSFTTNSVFVFEPNDYEGRVPPPCAGTDLTTNDEDDDGFSNADEIDNQTDPCSAADAPHDWDGNFVSDLNDPDDDGDGLADVSDPFAVDPDNGLTTEIPVSYSWDSGTGDPCAPTPSPSGCPGGLVGLGFTGLMSNGTSNYAALFDPAKLTAGGAPGVLTIDAVPAGDAAGSTNTQQYGFQFGVDANPAGTGVFTAHTRVLGPFAGVTPEGSQSMGLTIGRGDQDNYAKVVVSAGDGSPDIRLVKEVAGVETLASTAALDLAGPDSVDLYLTVDPQASTVEARYRVTLAGTPGPLNSLGPPEPIPSGWLTSGSRGLALGVIATSVGGAPFPATWDFLEATSGAPS